MQKFYYTLGGGLSLLGLWGIFVTATHGRGVGGVCGAAVFLLVGVLLLLAAFRDFRGHWALPVGLVMVASPLVLAAFFVHDRSLAGAHQDAIRVVSAAAVFGLGLLHTAFRFNRMAHQLEASARTPNQIAETS